MFNFLKRAPTSSEVPLRQFTSIYQDIHSHILPGLDDGSPDLETSLQLIKGLRSFGFRKLKGTPHIIGDLYRNSPEKIFPALEKIQKACKENEIDVEISAAAEYMLDDYFMSLLRNNEKLLPIHKNIILTELPYSSQPKNVEEMSFEILTAGYQPILAHPERYSYYQQNFEEYYRLKELGFILQINLLSVTGYYGKPVTKAVNFIIDKGLVDLVGTDLHHSRHLAALSQNISHIEKRIGNKPYNVFQ